MPRLLYTWEYGSDLGHISNFLPIAEKLLKLDWELIFAIPYDVPGIARTKRQLERLGCTYTNTPGSSVLGHNCGKTSCHAEMISQLIGIRNEQELGFFLDSWLTIIDKIQPDIVFCDYSITALIAANCKNIPSMVLDQGWFVPDLRAPARTHTFSQELGFQYLDASQQDIMAIQECELKLLTNLNQQLRVREYPELSSFLDIYKCDQLILNNFPELSTLTHIESSDFIGSFEQNNTQPTIDWPLADLSKPKIFIYLKANTPAFMHVMNTVAENGHYSVVAYIPGVSQVFANKHQQEHVTISTVPANVPELLKSANLVISNAGAGLSAQSLLAGVPLVMIPQWTEQQLNAKRVQNLQAGEVINYSVSQKEVAVIIERVLGNQIYLAKARQFKLNHQPAKLDEVVKKIDQVIANNTAEFVSKSSLEDSGTYISLSEFNWFYLCHSSLESDNTWQQIKQQIPEAQAIPLADNFWSSIDKAAQLATTDRFVTIKQGCELDPYLFIAEAECPPVQQHTHWYWNKLDSVTGLAFGSSNIACWNTKTLTSPPYSEQLSALECNEMHTFLRRPEFTPFAKVLSQTMTTNCAIQTFYQGYLTTLKMVNAFSGDIAHIIQYPSSVLVRRLFIHMSGSCARTSGAYYALGARIAFVNQFIRFKKGFSDINLTNAEEFADDALHYLSQNTPLAEIPFKQLTLEQLTTLVLQLGAKIRATTAKPPLLDMEADAAESFRNTLIANRNSDLHLFAPHSLSAAL